jgi:hypothetical protein
LDHDQKELVKQCVAEDKPVQEIYHKLLASFEAKNQGNSKVLKKIQNIAPLYDAHDFWDKMPVPKAYEQVDENMLDKPIDVDKTVE